MKITSPAFEDNGDIPKKYTCDGENFNPSLDFSWVPSGTKTLALVVDDPDALRGDFVHWLVWNIPATTGGIPENISPAEASRLGYIEGTTDFGKVGWGGPCPPGGSHRYFFKLYALKGELNIPSSAKKSDLEKAMAGQVVAAASLMGRFKR